MSSVEAGRFPGKVNGRCVRGKGRPDLPHGYGPGLLAVAAAVLARAVADAAGETTYIAPAHRAAVIAEARAWLTEAGLEFAEVLGVEGLLRQWLRGRR